MLVNDALALAQDMVNTRVQHCHYERTVNLANTYRALITGENAEFLLKRFVKREDDEAFEQRVAITINITPAVCANVMKPFNKVLRNNRVKKNYDFRTVTRNELVKKMAETFYGRKNSMNKGVDYWLRMRYCNLSFLDPNAWVVMDWKTPASLAAVIKPRPFEVKSESAWNWLIDEDELQWLWAHEYITYNRLVIPKGVKKAQAIADGVYCTEAGDKFTLYDTDNTLVLTQIDPDYLKSINYVKRPGEIFWMATGKVWYSVMFYTPNLGYVPAFRVGYEQDNETDGQTFVNGFHVAMPFLEKSIKAVSEMDLTMSLHTFPQKIQYVQRCPGVDKKPCNKGRLADGTTICSRCKGTGAMVHTSAQDAILFPMPSDPANADLIDLEKLLVYKAPPIDLIKFQDEYIDKLTVKCTNAVFTTTQQTKVTNTMQGGAPSTATEVQNNMEGQKDALLPFTEKVSEVWTEIIFTCGRLAGVPESADVLITCVFPADLKMKSIDELLVDLKNANDAGAPAFLRDQIYNDIAEIMYEGDEIAARKYATKHQFYPFNGQTDDTIALNMASQYVTPFTKVLYANYEAIFNDIDLENPGFWFLEYGEQWDIIEKMVDEYMQELETANTLSLDMPGDTPPGGGGTNTPGDNADAANNDGGGTTEPKPGEPGYIEPTEE